MSDLIIVDYIGNSNNSGELSGHLLKVLKELNVLLSDDCALAFIVADNYVPYTKDLNVIENIKRISIRNSRLGRIIQRFINIQKIISTGDNIWFVNVDFWFYFIINLMNVKNKKLYATNYINYTQGNGLSGWIKKIIYSRGSAKLRYEFTTSKKLQTNNQVYVPDYWFDESIYQKYKTDKRKNQVVFCGGISSAKEVEGLVRAFSLNKQLLLIQGLFESETLYKKVIDNATSNIEIHNQRLSDVAYYSGIGSSEFVILPYKKEHYQGRSSGVILEAVFLDTIVIAPKFLLEELGIDGIGYKDIAELSTFSIQDVREEKRNQILLNNKKYKEEYSASRVKQIYLSHLI